MQAHSRTLVIEALSAEAFAPFGDVIAARDGVKTFAINQGYATRFHDLARVDVADQGGGVCVSIFQAVPRVLPMQLSVMERHPLGSQAFMPLSPLPYLVVVAEAAPGPDLARLRCFRAAPGQGVNYARGTWHHPLLALQAESEFLVVDRGGAASDANCDEYPLTDTPCWVGEP